MAVASAGTGIHRKAILTAAEVMAALSRGSISGQDNFRFVASACIPADTPFFPAAWHSGEDSFGIGLETPNLLSKVFSDSADIADASTRLKASLDAALLPIESKAREFADVHRLRYAGIDASPAPGLDASIGKAIEALTGKPFGSASTLAACAAITSGLKTLKVKTCGYSGLMLPVVEDKVLAERASEGRYGLSELLLCSSVCRTLGTLLEAALCATAFGARPPCRRASRVQSPDVDRLKDFQPGVIDGSGRARNQRRGLGP